MISQIRTVRGAIAVAMIAATLSLAGPGASAAVTTPQVRALPADLAHALEAYHQATMHNDAKTLSDLVTDDYVLVNSDSSLQDKASYLADFAVPGFKLDPYEVEPLDYEVRGDAALTAWTFTLGWTLDGRHQTRRLRMAQFWVRQHGQWRIAYAQLTRIPE